MKLRAIPLGTSAGRPTLQRGASALAVVAEGSWVLCDCGEGAQLAALRAGLSLSRLDAILITHLHGDHFNGLPGLLGTLGLEGRERELLLVGPRGLRAALEFLQRCGSLGLGPLPLRVLELSGRGGEIEWGGPFELLTRPLEHRIETFGYRIALPARAGTLDVEAARAAGVPNGPLLGALKAGQAVTLPDGRRVLPDALVGPRRPGSSVAYVLDTIPCATGIELARGVGLLVHEATYEHGRAQLARERGHSTALEAARIAREAGAQALLLTHFSPSVTAEELADEARPELPATIAASDGQEVAVPPPGVEASAG